MFHLLEFHSLSKVVYSGTTTLIVSGSGSITKEGIQEGKNFLLYQQVRVESGILGIGPKSFQGCIKLETVTLSNTVTILEESSFLSCSSLHTISFGNTLTHIHSLAFSQCGQLKSLLLPGSLVFLGSQAFYSSNSLSIIKFMDESHLQEIGASCFEGCSSFSDFIIPHTVLKIGAKAFRSTLIADLELPTELTELGNQAFELTQVKSFSISSENLYFCVENGVVYNKELTTLVVYPCKKTGDFTVPNSITTLTPCCFSGSQFQKLTLSLNIKVILPLSSIT